MNKIQQQLAAIHLLTHTGNDVGASDTAIEAATAAFAELANDIFSRGSGATGAQKELLHAVLAGAPLTRAKREDLDAIKAHIGSAKLTGRFEAAGQAYLASRPASPASPAPQARAPSVGTKRSRHPETGPLGPSAKKSPTENGSGPIPADTLDAFTYAKGAVPTHRRNGQPNLTDADFSALQRYELQVPGMDPAIVAFHQEAGAYGTLRETAQSLAKFHKYTAAAHIALVETFVGRTVRVWSQDREKGAVTLPNQSVGPESLAQRAIHVLASSDGSHYDAFQVTEQRLDDAGNLRAAPEDCHINRVPGDGSCFFYAVLHETNRDGYRDAYDLVARGEKGDPSARRELVALIRRNTWDSYRIDDQASLGQLFRTYGEYVAHNFRQDIAADVIDNPSKYAPVLHNVEA